jgi:hypothetical protein
VTPFATGKVVKFDCEAKKFVHGIIRVRDQGPEKQQWFIIAAVLTADTTVGLQTKRHTKSTLDYKCRG